MENHLLKFLSVLTAILFFPVGIAAKEEILQGEENKVVVQRNRQKWDARRRLRRVNIERGPSSQGSSDGQNRGAPTDPSMTPNTNSQNDSVVQGNQNSRNQNQGGRTGQNNGSSGSPPKSGLQDRLANNANPPEKGNQNREASPNSMETPGGNKAISFPHFYPVCWFITSDVTEDVNAAVKGYVDEAAKCNVNLLVYPITVKPLPDDDVTINRYQQAACNLAQALGVKTASTTTCISGMEAPAKMCGSKDGHGNWDTQVAGCAQLHAAGGGKINMRDHNAANGGASLAKFNGNGGAVPSIERRGACSKSVVGHESLGHSQMGKPNGSDHGNGIGDPDPRGNQQSGSEGSGSGGWTDKGCATMRANAYQNTAKYSWNPDRKVYYVKKTNPEHQIDLSKQVPLFGGRNVTGGDGGSPTPPIRKASGDTPREKASGPSIPPRSGLSRNNSAAPDPHKKKPQLPGNEIVDKKIQDIIDRNKQVSVQGEDIKIAAPSESAPVGPLERPPIKLGPPKSTSVIYKDNAGGGSSEGVPSGAEMVPGLGGPSNGTSGPIDNSRNSNVVYGGGGVGTTASDRTPSSISLSERKKNKQEEMNGKGRKTSRRQPRPIRVIQTPYESSSANSIE